MELNELNRDQRRLLAAVDAGKAWQDQAGTAWLQTGVRAGRPDRQKAGARLRPLVAAKLVVLGDNGVFKLTTAGDALNASMPEGQAA